MPFCGPWAWPLIISEHVPQIPSRQSWSNVIGSRPSLMSRSLTRSSISRNDISSLTSGASSTSKRPSSVGTVLSPDPECEVEGLSSTCSSERRGGRSRTRAAPCAALPWPGSPVHSHALDVGEVLVVAHRLALLGLVLDSEVAAAGLLAVEGVQAHQLGQFEEVVDPPAFSSVWLRLAPSPVTRRSLRNSSCSAGISPSAFSSPSRVRSMPQ